MRNWECGISGIKRSIHICQPQRLQGKMFYLAPNSNDPEHAMKIFRLKDLEWIPASHENRESPSVWKKALLQKADLSEGRVQMVNWCRMEPEKAFRAHYHEDMEEIFIILKGQAKILVHGEEAELGKGEAVVIPPREVHEMKNAGGEDLEYLAVGISQGRGGKTVVV
jgi:mannose-6-phosphate isomerase-like protein (cupin superfamily)